MLENKNILLAVTGSIAAYKAADLTSKLVKSGANVRVLMTESACRFVSPHTFEALSGNMCITDIFDSNHEYKAAHVSLAKEADIFVVVPASANTIAKLACGIADNMVCATALACTCKKIICPAMNTLMYENIATQENIAKCIRYGFKVIDSECGYLACGDTGKGKLASVDAIYENILMELQYEKDFAGKKILVTAGPTRESIDPVRYITNHSSGKMGYAIARAAAYRGADVTLVSGPVSITPPLGVKLISVTSAREMFEAVRDNFSDKDIIIKSAAVADYTPASYSDEKIKKSSDDMSLPLERTEDILKFLGENKKENQILCGFSMETENMIENSRKKLLKKNLDLIVANSLRTKGAGFQEDTNEVTVITRDGQIFFPLASKESIASSLLSFIKNLSKV